MKQIILLYTVVLIIGCNTGTRNNGYNTDKFRNVDEKIDSSLFNLDFNDTSDFITLKIPSKFEVNEYFDYEDIIDTIWYVRLETNKKSLIEYIEKVIVYNKNIYILDAISGFLLKFDSKGRFVTQIGEKGKGPGEYTSPLDFEIDEEKILLLDDLSGKIKYYDLSGDFLKEVSLTFRMNNFTKYNNGYLCNIASRGNFHIPQISNYRLIFCNHDWKIVGVADKYNAKIESNLSLSRKEITKSGNSYIYNPSFDYYIYSIKRDCIKRKYYIDVDKRMIQEDNIYNLSSEEFIQKYLSRDCNKMFLFNSVFETNNNLIATLHYNGIDVPLYYSKKSDNLICNSNYKFSPKLPFGYIVPKGICNDTLIGYIEPYVAVQKLESLRKETELFNLLSKKQQRFVNEIKEDENPILVFYKLKEF